MAKSVSEDNKLWSPAGPYWTGIDRLLRNAGPFSSDLERNAANGTQNFLRQHCRVLVIGAGGLGCELLKDLALSGFRHIDVIDLDTIDVTNLNRQFLFRSEDVGQPKAKVAAAFVNRAVPSANVVPHHGNIMDFDKDFYRQFNIVIAGLDSIDARRWLNAMLVSLVEFESDGSIMQSSIVPLIDGGTEGFQGQARVIVPRISSCFECTLSLFPPPRNFPLCTIANTPRLPEHCVEYAKIVLWEKKKPFGDVSIDMDDVKHATWLYEEAKARAAQFNIHGVTYRLTQGVAKNIVPAVAATNAIIAATCVNEAVKMITSMARGMDNYMMYNGLDGVYTFTYRNERRHNCPVSGAPQPHKMNVKGTSPLSEFLELVATDAELRAPNPFLRTASGKTLYASAPAALRVATSANLDKQMKVLLETSPFELTLSDKDLPFARTLIITLDEE